MSAPTNEDFGRIPILEEIRNQGEEKTWDVLAPQYGVTNENPPWKTSLVAMCDCLGGCGAIPALEIRNSEDELSDSVYNDVPAPERQLLALAHTMLRRGLVGEGELAKRMEIVRSRLEAV